MSLRLPPDLTWSELARRTWREAFDDDLLDLAAQLAYYFFLALFPTILFGLALASFFPLTQLTDDLGRVLGPVVSPDVLRIVQDQMRRIADADSGGLLTFGALGALWSSSAALVSIADALNRAYDIEEGRPWWKVRLTAIGLTIGLALVILTALSLVLAGPTLADWLGRRTGLGTAFEWTWLILQWPIAVLLVALAIGVVYYFGPDAEQDWTWITPGALFAALAWLGASLLFKFYVAKFADYQATYGAVGGVVVLLLWFYVSSIAVLIGAELNAEIEHASPQGKNPGEKALTPEGRRVLGDRARRQLGTAAAAPAPPPAPRPPSAPPRPAIGAVAAATVLALRAWHRRQEPSHG
jgi:membrane protein